MAKKKQNVPSVSNAQGTTTYQHNCGVIKDNAIQALLHDRLFRQRIEKKLKGKGSYQRKAKHANRYFEKPDHKISITRDFMIGFFLTHFTINTVKHNIRGKYVCKNRTFI